MESLRPILSAFLATVYIVIVSPIALVLRLAGENPLHVREGAQEGSYWRTLDVDSADRGGYERLY